MGPTITKSKKSNKKNGKPSGASSSRVKEPNAKINMAEGAKSSRLEIDDIFSGRGEVATLKTTESPTAVGSGKKKKKKKDKHVEGTNDKQEGGEEEWTGFGNADTAVDEHVSFPKPNPPLPKVETVLDPSSSSMSTSNFRKRKWDDVVPATSNTHKKTGKSVSANDDNAERFKDSRGTGPRRKTEEGYSVYKEDELGIRDAGGDTPLCPFDCDCSLLSCLREIIASPPTKVLHPPRLYRSPTSRFAESGETMRRWGQCVANIDKEHPFSPYHACGDW